MHWTNCLLISLFAILPVARGTTDPVVSNEQRIFNEHKGDFDAALEAGDHINQRAVLCKYFKKLNDLKTQYHHRSFKETFESEYKNRKNKEYLNYKHLLEAVGKTSAAELAKDLSQENMKDCYGFDSALSFVLLQKMVDNIHESSVDDRDEFNVHKYLRGLESVQNVDYPKDMYKVLYPAIDQQYNLSHIEPKMLIEIIRASEPEDEALDVVAKVIARDLNKYMEHIEALSGTDGEQSPDETLQKLTSLVVMHSVNSFGVDSSNTGQFSHLLKIAGIETDDINSLKRLRNMTINRNPLNWLSQSSVIWETEDFDEISYHEVMEIHDRVDQLLLAGPGFNINSVYEEIHNHKKIELFRKAGVAPWKLRIVIAKNLDVFEVNHEGESIEARLDSKCKNHKSSCVLLDSFKDIKHAIPEYTPPNTLMKILDMVKETEFVDPALYFEALFRMSQVVPPEEFAPILWEKTRLYATESGTLPTKLYEVLPTVSNELMVQLMDTDDIEMVADLLNAADNKVWAGETASGLFTLLNENEVGHLELIKMIDPRSLTEVVKGIVQKDENIQSLLKVIKQCAEEVHQDKNYIVRKLVRGVMNVTEENQIMELANEVDGNDFKRELQLTLQEKRFYNKFKVPDYKEPSGVKIELVAYFPDLEEHENTEIDYALQREANKGGQSSKDKAAEESKPVETAKDVESNEPVSTFQPETEHWPMGISQNLIQNMTPTQCSQLTPEQLQNIRNNAALNSAYGKACLGNAGSQVAASWIVTMTFGLVGLVFLII